MSKRRAYGADARLIAAVEATYGTAPAGGAYRSLDFKQTDLSSEQKLGEDPLLGRGRNAQDPYRGLISDEGSVEIPLDVRGIGFWLYALLGPAVTTGTGPYTHVWASGADTLPSLTVEIGHPRLQTPTFFRHTGTMVESLDFDLGREGAANATLKLVAQGEEPFGVTIDATPEPFVLKRFSQARGYIKRGATALAGVTGGKLSFSNNLERVRTIRDDGKIDGADPTIASVKGSLTSRFDGATLLAEAASGDPISLEYGFTTGSGQSLSFLMPRVFLPKPKYRIAGPGGVEASFDWQAAHDETSGTMMTVTLINDVAEHS
ncbi:MAG: phage tail tube protein [Alphaproteobacteria bacterium]